MLPLAFLQWWYGPGWRARWTGLGPRVRRTYYSFSVPQLAATLFAPWRRIITTGGGSLPDRFRAMVDNAVSRVIGGVVRIGAILIAGLIILGLTIFGLILSLLWPFIPVAALVFIIWGII